MKIKITSLLLVTLTSFHTFASATEVNCESIEDAKTALNKSYKCSPRYVDCNSAVDQQIAKLSNLFCRQKQNAIEENELQKLLKEELVKSEQQNCNKVVNDKCNFYMFPDVDTRCFIKHEETEDKKVSYIVYYNKNLKLFTSVLPNHSCQVEQTYVAGKLKQVKTYSNNLVFIANGKIMFFDHEGVIKEFLSKDAISYSHNGAFIEKLNVNPANNSLVVSRRYSVNTPTIQSIVLHETDLQNSKRQETVFATEDLNKEVTVNVGDKKVTIYADVIR